MELSGEKQDEVSQKDPQVSIREMEDKDWRGLIAYTGLVGLLVIIGGCLIMGHADYAKDAAAYLSGPVFGFAGYYFKIKEW